MLDDMMDDKVFLALDVWREARNQTLLGQTAVAYSVLNRVARPSWWGSDIMTVLFKKWQYSSLTDPKDRQLTTWPVKDSVWKQCLNVACDAISGVSGNPVPGADSYWDDSISAPKWATPDKFVRKIGQLNFYNVDMDHEVSHA